MDFDKIEDYLKLMRSLKIKSVGLLGGEPTQHPKLLEIVKLIKKYKFKVTLYTNGRKLNDEDFARKLKKVGLDFVNFSIQSGSRNAKEHDSTVNVKGAWLETKKGIENCHKHKLKINIQTVLTHSDLETYKELIDEFRYANLFIYYRQIPPIITNCNFFNQKVISNKETKEIYKKIYSYAKIRKIRSYLFSRMPLCWWDKDDLLEKEIHESVVCHCHILTGSILTIDIDGRVLACPQYINLHTMNLVKDNKILSKKEFLGEFNNKAPEKFRKKLKYAPDKRCLDCEYFGKRCTGGCPLIDFEIGPHAKTFSKHISRP